MRGWTILSAVLVMATLAASELSHSKPVICAWVHSHKLELRTEFRKKAKPFIDIMYFMLDIKDEKLDSENDLVIVPEKVDHLHIFIKARYGLDKMRTLIDKCDWFLKVDEDAIINWEFLSDILKMTQPLSYPIFGGYMYYFTLGSMKPADEYFAEKPLPFAPYANGPIYYFNRELFKLMEPFSSEDIFWTGHAEDACIGVFMRDYLSEPVLFHDVRGHIFGKYMVPLAPPENSCYWLMLHEIPDGSVYRPPCPVPRELLPSVGIWAVSRQKEQARRLTLMEMNNIFGHVYHSDESRLGTEASKLHSELESQAGMSFDEVPVQPLPGRQAVFYNFTAITDDVAANLAVDLFRGTASVHSSAVLDLKDTPTELVIDLTDTEAEPNSFNFGALEKEEEGPRVQKLDIHATAPVENEGTKDIIQASLERHNEFLVSLSGKKPWDPKFLIHNYRDVAWASFLFTIAKTRAVLVSVGKIIFDDLIGLAAYKLASKIIHLPCDPTHYVEAYAEVKKLDTDSISLDPRCVTVRPVLREAELVLKNPPTVKRVHIHGNTMGRILADYGISSSTQVVIMASLEDRRTVASIYMWAKAQPIKPYLVLIGWAPPGTRIVLQKLTAFYGPGHSAHEGNAYMFGPTVYTSTCCGPEHPIDISP